MASITSLPSGVSGGSLVLISEQTASSSATIDFTSDIDSTYKEYQFHFTDIHPATNSADFSFQVDTGTNTSYNQTMTTTAFRGLHTEDDGTTSLNYDTGRDLAQSTSFKILGHEVGNGNDEIISGILHLFEPSSTTFVKHFMATVNIYAASDMSENKFTAGYINTTTALTRVRFKFSSGNIDAGTIKMYGVV